MNKRRLKAEELEKAIHDLYDGLLLITNLDEYKNLRDNISFTCLCHGEFAYNTRSILGGSGCPYCNLIKKVSLILSANKVNNKISDGKVILDNGISIGIDGCDINISLTDNIYDILSDRKIIYDDSKVKERWKSLDGYSKYKISNLGRVKNLESNKFLNGYNMNKSGYVQKMINLFDDNKKLHGILLHRLVYSTFNGVIPSNINIDHIDGNFLNNRLANLRVCNNIKDNINNEITILSIKINAYNRNMEKKEPTKHDYDVSSLDSEKWVDVIGMEDLYEVSNLGRIRSKVIPIEYNRKGVKFIVNRPPKLLKQHIKAKYMFISLGRNDNRVHLPVHKIVYESFNGKLSEGLEIDHINSDCKDNRLCNLQAITHANNLAKREFNIKKNIISEYYDRTISDAKNIENMKSKGFIISVDTLRKWRKENGIERWHSLKAKKDRF